jgi:transcriptional regulator with XRE-family HTH domain
MRFLAADAAAKTAGQSLRARRKALGISMTAAAEAAQMSRVTWYRLEKGEAGVAWGFLLAAATVLGLQIHLLPEDATQSETESTGQQLSLQQWLPLDIALADFPGLQRLAWQLQEGLDHVTPREAWGLYDRNWRHLDVEGLTSRERALIGALGKTFGAIHGTV